MRKSQVLGAQGPALSVPRFQGSNSGLDIRRGATILCCDDLSQLYLQQKLPWLYRLGRTLVGYPGIPVLRRP